MMQRVFSSCIKERTVRGVVALVIAAGIASCSVGCGGGSRGTGIYGVDGLRPGKFTQEDQRIPLHVDPEATTTPTPKPEL